MKEPVSVKNPMIVTSPYGDRIIEGKAQFHRGVDLRNFDRPIFAVDDSTLIRFGYGKMGEGFLVLKSKDYVFKYIHVAWVGGFTKGWDFQAGDPLGVTDLSGTKSLHLHFEVWDLAEKTTYNPCMVFDDYGLKWRLK